MLILNEIFPRVNILQYLNYHRIEGPPAANYRSASTLSKTRSKSTHFFSLYCFPQNTFRQILTFGFLRVLTLLGTHYPPV